MKTKDIQTAECWFFRGMDYSLYPNLSTNLLFVAVVFSTTALLSWWLHPPIAIAWYWIAITGIVSCITVTFSLEVVLKFRLPSLGSNEFGFFTWAFEVMFLLLMAAVVFYVFIGPPADSYPDGRSPSPVSLSAIRWAPPFFITVVLYAIGLHMLVKYSRRKATEEERMDEAQFQWAMICERTMSGIQSMAMSTIVQDMDDGDKLEITKRWKEQFDAYFKTSAEEFRSSPKSLSIVSLVPLTSTFAWRGMLEWMNVMLVGGPIVIDQVEKSEFVVLRYKNRKVRLRDPEIDHDPAALMDGLDELLEPDYEIRHCKFLAEINLADNLFAFLRPDQWREMEADYGKKKVKAHFQSIGGYEKMINERLDKVFPYGFWGFRRLHAHDRF